MADPSRTLGSGGRFGRFRRIAGPLAGAIVVGVIGSGVWDVIAKPGLSRAGTALIRAVTFGSTAVRDLPFSSAALNPYPLASLVMLLLLVVSVLFPAVWFLLEAYLRPRVRDHFKRKKDAFRAQAGTPEEAKELLKKWRVRRRKRLALGMAAYYLLLFAWGYVAAGVLNQAITVRRLDEANRQILAPLITQQELAKLDSEFASITDQAGFLRLHSAMGDIARRRGVSLRPEQIH